MLCFKHALVQASLSKIPIINMPPWPVRQRSTSSSHVSIPIEEDGENDGYVDVLDEITNLSPSLHEEMQEFLRTQAKAEFSSSLTPISPNKPWGNLSTELSRRARRDISMDADILKDPVKQKDICEMTNFNDSSPEARKRRYKRRWDVPNDVDISEVVQYTDDDEADRRFSEEYDRKDSEVTSGFCGCSLSHTVLC